MSTTEFRGGEGLGRRTFLGRVSAGAAALALGIGGQPRPGASIGVVGPQALRLRRNEAREIRREMAQLAFRRPLPEHPQNGEEREYPYVANFSKGLPHDEQGEVDARAYQRLLDALASDDEAAFEAIPLGGVRRLRNPMAGAAFDLEGADSHHLAMRPAPRIDSPEHSAEAGELYWMALARDVDFTQYGSHELLAAACDEMSGFSDFRGPTQSGRVTPATIFRGNTPGDLAGPYVSQFPPDERRSWSRRGVTSRTGRSKAVSSPRRWASAGSARTSRSACRPSTRPRPCGSETSSSCFDSRTATRRRSPRALSIGPSSRASTRSSRRS